MRTLLAALVLMVCCPFVAEAGYCASHGWRQVCRGWPAEDCYRQRYCREWVRDEPTRVYGYERRLEREEAPRMRCLYEYPAIRATGDDKLEEDRAQVSAQDRWSIEVETLRGTRFSDIRNAAYATSSCVRKVPTSATEKGQAALGVRHFVCQYEAIPCASPKLPQDEDTRAKRSSEKREDEVRRNDPREGYYESPRKRRFLDRWRRGAQ